MAATTLTITPALTHHIRIEAISADSVATHDTIAFLASHAKMACTVHEDSSTDVSDSSTDVSGDEAVAGIIVLVMK